MEIKNYNISYIRQWEEIDYDVPVWVHFDACNCLHIVPKNVVQQVFERENLLAGVPEPLEFDRRKMEEFSQICEIFTADSLKLASFALDESRYHIRDALGKYYPDVKQDMENGPGKTVSFMGKLATLLYVRYQSEAKPLTLVCMDHCWSNGNKLRNAILPFAREWELRDYVWEGFTEYLEMETAYKFHFCPFFSTPMSHLSILNSNS